MSATPTFTSERERKNFSAGIALANQKIQGHHRLTADEREAASIAQGRAIIAKRLGAAVHKKLFGTLPASPSARPATAPARAVKTYHRYCTGGLFR